jgi:hypothetical protein
MRSELKTAIATAVEAYLREENKTPPTAIRRTPEPSQWRLFGRGETVSGQLRWQANRTRR